MEDILLPITSHYVVTVNKRDPLGVGPSSIELSRQSHFLAPTNGSGPSWAGGGPDFLSLGVKEKQ